MARNSQFTNLLFLFLFSCMYKATFAFSECNIPPQFWCDTVDVAKQCGVLEQCDKWKWSKINDAPLVDFTLYYESLCGGCQDFFRENLSPTYNKLHSIMNLTLVPYGNAEESREGNRWKFDCQHGPLECQGNIIDTCAINIVKNISVYFPFIACMERTRSKPITAAHECAKDYPVPIDAIINCSNSDQGNSWEHEMAVKTDALQPPHQYVPWVTLNGVHTEKIQDEAQNNLLKLICTTYTGPKPTACQTAETELRTSNHCNKNLK